MDPSVLSPKLVIAWKAGLVRLQSADSETILELLGNLAGILKVSLIHMPYIILSVEVPLRSTTS